MSRSRVLSGMVVVGVSAGLLAATPSVPVAATPAVPAGPSSAADAGRTAAADLDVLFVGAHPDDEAWALEHIARAAATVIQYETDGTRARQR